jgi:hypothetical protein
MTESNIGHAVLLSEEQSFMFSTYQKGQNDQEESVQTRPFTNMKIHISFVVTEE